MLRKVSLHSFNPDETPIVINPIPKHNRTCCQNRSLSKEKESKKMFQALCLSICPIPSKKGISPEERPCINKLYARDPTECKYCKRHFIPERRDFHESICSKKKQRTVYDSAIHRVKGTSLEKYLLKKTKRKETKCPKDWHLTNENFLLDIYLAKQAHAFVLRRRDILNSLPPPPPSKYPIYIECPYCRRKFNELAAEIHIHKCAATPHEPEPLTECLLEYY